MPTFSHPVPRYAARFGVGAVALLTAAALVLGLQSGAPLLAQQSGSDLARTLAAAKSWGYQLQDVDPEVIAASPYDMVVIDYSRDGTSETAFTPAELEAMKKKPDGGRRIVLSYLSIGEAEKYRYYWKWYWGWFFGWFAPSWRDRQNKEWRGNYAVRYWDPGWQDIIFSGENSYLDRIVKAGFDGVWLDKVDEFEYYEKKPDAQALMITFVTRLAAHARNRKPGFLVVPQNGEALLSDGAYRVVIDGIGKEDILYGEDEDKKPNNPESIAHNVTQLKLLTAEGKPVFAVEYLDSPQRIAGARKRLLAYGFVPHFADRSLDNLRVGDLPDPARKSGKK
ncbi:MAG: MJ1477/TM1410 family putative glycoside hydrolase [Xanthobacteraceae bacterium]